MKIVVQSKAEAKAIKKTFAEALKNAPSRIKIEPKK